MDKLSEKRRQTKLQKSHCIVLFTQNWQNPAAKMFKLSISIRKRNFENWTSYDKVVLSISKPSLKVKSKFLDIDKEGWGNKCPRGHR